MNKKKWAYALGKDGLVAYNKDKALTIRFDHSESDEILKKKIDYSSRDYNCEICHLELSDFCNMKCPYCYVGRKRGKELDTKSWFKIIDNLSAAGIFQCSAGGGEPTLRGDLIKIAEYVNNSGMNFGMTTNGTLLPDQNPKLLRKYFKQINVSFHSNPEVINNALKFLYNNKIPAGINYCFSRELSQWDGLVKHLARIYNAELLYLVYKPVIGDLDNQIPAEEVLSAAKKANAEGLWVAVDGPCMNKCMASKKFVDVDSMGNVFQCSFVRRPIGNLLKEDFRTIWKNRGKRIECPFVNFNKGENCVK